MDRKLDRAQGCLLGQFIGDSLGSLVEFQSHEQIARAYPDGVRELADGGTWNTIAGQPTDDSEMALMLARTLIEHGTYDQTAARAAYVDWLNSRPFDVGNTVRAGLQGTPNFESQANGALMRVSPLGIFGSVIDRDLAARFAREDAWITHPNEVAQDANIEFILTIADAIAHELDPAAAYRRAQEIAKEHGLVETVSQAVNASTDGPPESYARSKGWVLIALRNAFYQLIHAESFEEALVDTVGRGGDTDTNAAICGALLGAVYGRAEIPDRWIEVVLECRPEPGRPGVQRPRPREYWPVDALELAEQLLNEM